VVAHDKLQCTSTSLSRNGVPSKSSMSTPVTDSCLTDPDEQRWRVLLEWLKGHGMLIDEDHLLVRPKHVAGTS
jgi:hypothetical protein